MKTQISLIAIFVISSFAACAQRFYVKGSLKPNDAYKHTMVYLLKLDHLDNFLAGSNFDVVDSSEIDTKGNFQFINTDVIEDNTFYRINIVDTTRMNPGGISMQGTHQNFVFLLLNKHSQLQFRTTVDEVTQNLVFTKYDQANYLLYRLYGLQKNHNEIVNEHIQRRNALDHNSVSYQDSVKQINAQMNTRAFNTSYFATLGHFADTVRNPYVSLLAMQSVPDDSFHQLYVKMDKRYQHEIPHSKYAQQFENQLNGVSGYLKVGSMAPEIALPDTKGNIIKLSELRGKYVLVDFWASWCHPCRNENVHYIKPLYGKYHNKGFEVLSVSQDITKASWLSALQTDETDIWYQVSDLKGSASKTVNEYHVISLPYNYLVDPKGIIIAQNLRGTGLGKTIDKIYGDK